MLYENYIIQTTLNSQNAKIAFLAKLCMYNTMSIACIILCDCIYGFSNCGLRYEEAKYCLCHVASD